MRSRRTEPGPPAEAVVQGEVLPASSVERNCTRVVPSRETVVDVSAVVVPQVEPRSSEVRYWVPATPEAASEEDDETAREAAVDHTPSAPLWETPGAVRSMRTLPSLPTVAGDQALALPAESVARNCTRVTPSALTSTDAPATGVDQLEPLSVEVRWSVAATAETASALVALTVIVAAFVQVPVAPEADTVGLPRSSRTVCDVAQAERLPTASTARKRTRVSPSAEMTVLAPACGAPHDDPPSVLAAHSKPASPEPASAPALTQLVDPPEAAGTAGAVRSRRTEPVPPDVAVLHGPALPALSTARNCRRVSPSAVTSADAPGTAADQVPPPSVDRRDS